MIVLHAGVAGRLYVWGERPPEKTKPGSKYPLPLPFDAGSAPLAETLREHAGVTAKRTACEKIHAWIPTEDTGDPHPSSGLIAENPEPGGTVELAAWIVHALPLDNDTAIDFLCRCANRDTLAPGVVIAPDLAFWAAALRFAGNLVAREHFLPDMEWDGRQYRAVWKPVLLGPDQDRLHTLAAAMPPAARCLDKEHDHPPDVAPVTLLNTFIARMVDALVRSGGKGSQHSLHDRWLHALRAKDGALAGPLPQLQQLSDQTREWRRPIALSIDAPFRLCFRLEEPPDNDSEWFLRFLLQGSRDPSLLVPAETVWQPDGPNAAVLRHPDFDPREHLLLSLGQASAICPEIEGSLKTTGAPAGYQLDSPGAHGFLTDRAMALEQAGFAVQLPSWWTRKGTKNKLSAAAHIKTPFQTKGGLSLSQIVKFEWRAAIGGEQISLEELESLADLKSPLVKFRGQWIQMNAGEIKAALDFWKKRNSGKATVREVIQMALGKPAEVKGLEFGGVTAEGWICELLDQLQGKATFEELPAPKGLNAKLRPYQLRGYSWLAFLRRWGLGSCLADDMGLGKTIQTLSLLEADRAAGQKNPVLLVCPTSVVENWRKEAARFTPGLAVSIHHGVTRAKGDAFTKHAKEQGLVISSYALLHRDLEMLKEVEWGGVILDEAQNIKNSATRQSTAARALPSEYRIALTGTPVENNVGDLWSIMEFLNPGFLGTQAEFKRNFFQPIQSTRDPEAANTLRKLTGPFILRRLKTDRSIISDLPDKLEMKVFCTLTREQASLYAAVADDAMKAVEQAEGIKRKGVVLATLAKLKQVCNHPAHFLGDNSAIPGRSGKLARLTEMLEEAIAAGDRALVFTQFAEMGEILRKHLQETFGREVMFLHGGKSKKQRDEMVERFQSDDGPPIFLLSLKAGGTGLTLTRANHVFHFDRWWNPAVENQATDRAFRIGQSKNVQVHKFICSGTLEEKIDDMIESKKQIAADVVGSGENWLTELSTSDLKDLFALRKEAVSE
jgi:superfamily II DNA or RNA helicase